MKKKLPASAGRVSRLVVPLPCPFCGHIPSLEFDEGIRGTIKSGWYVECQNPDCEMHVRTISIWAEKTDPESEHEDAKREAVKIWNSRHNAWQPIETAPEDGTEILVYAGSWNEICIAHFGTRSMTWSSRNADGGTCFPTHWMPLPAAPVFQA